VELHEWGGSSRPCRFSLCIGGGSVYADFDVDPTGAVFAVRVSFDGYGCCTCPPDVPRMDAGDSARLLEMVERGTVVQQVAVATLRRYFGEIQDLLWVDALRDHELI
jgi:hypothetical protein